MSVYVMSDIHGCYDKFRSMLEKIVFGDSDKLILAGDYIDKGKQNYEMMNWIMSSPHNVTFLRGNHDHEYTAYVKYMLKVDKEENLETDMDSSEEAEVLYDTVKFYFIKNFGKGSDKLFDVYGGLKDIILSGATLRELINFSEKIMTFPLFCKMKENGKKYIIVHAGYTDDFEKISPQKYESAEEFYLYAKGEYKHTGKENTTVIAGHAPTNIKGDVVFNDGKVYHYYNKKIKSNFYDIDCGCALGESNSHLACIRLGDEKIFYV